MIVLGADFLAWAIRAPIETFHIVYAIVAAKRISFTILEAKSFAQNVSYTALKR